MGRIQWVLALIAAVMLAGAATASTRSYRTNHYEMHGTLMNDSPRTSYVLVREGEESVSGSGEGDDFSTARSWRDRFKGDFLYLRIEDDTYVTQDRELIQRTIDAMKPVEEIGKKQGEIGHKQGEIGHLQGEVGRLQGKLGAEQGRLAARQARLAAAGNDDEAEQRAIDQRNREISEQMDQLGQQMERLGRRMEPLGRQQAELGEQQARASEHLKDVMEQVMKDAIDRHLAQRVAR